ncbi:hypothetical protein Scep_023557 [Stephania cephalantha]|uniref:non-specific serine/threonine protein kinase n=1 Tax=Stephania cephalantha TaxID=152367 RepID=A0AAP0F0B7_9MAGN
MSLLSFKAGVVSDPEHALQSWGTNGSHWNHVCNWTGIECNSRRNHVVQIDLGGRSLRGTISPALSNLTFLLVLDLSNNFFTGRIPLELGSLFRLKELSFSTNMLKGDIPAELSFLHQLVYLNLGSNRLKGKIPGSLLCNGSSLFDYIDLSNNSLEGEIPLRNHCGLTELRFLLLWSNRLLGNIPSALSNSTKLQWLDLESNFLNGDLPSETVSKMPHLQFLYLSDNNFGNCSRRGNANLELFFSSLVNCSNLQELEFSGNSLVGELPPFIGNLSTKLKQINLAENLIHGSIPPTISNLFNLTLLNLSSNLLNGSIPSQISRMVNLERVFFSNNSLYGEIPSAFGNIPRLGLLDLSNNKLSGAIPDSLSNLSQLRRLLLNGNQLSGTIPPSLGKCTNLEILDLSHNKISGVFPSEVAELRSLKLYLNLSSNLLRGPIPLELSKMDMVLAIDLSMNNFSGTIPPQLGTCIALEYLNLSSNLLQGPLPTQIGNLPYLRALDVSSNQLTGELPEFLQSSSTLRKLNISFNDFLGTVPNVGIFTSLTLDSVQGNPGLCGLIHGMQLCRKGWNHHRRKILLILLMLLACPVLCFFGYPLLLKARARRASSAIFGDNTISEDEENEKQEKHKYPRISYHQLVQATNGFNSSCLIGSGRFGHVYKGVLRDNTRIAVKVLDMSTMEGEILKSFKRECQVLKRTRHRNLIRIITTCTKPDFKALVLPLMPNGSLENHLYPIHGSEHNLSLVQVVNICSDIAQGMAYLHHYSHVRVIHCDLKPSNILLNDDMTALVTDFGIARFAKSGGEGSYRGENTSVLDPSSSFPSTAGLLCGSIGYIPPGMRL